ncbi:MAG: TadE family protein [Acidobacteriota bacterium]
MRRSKQRGHALLELALSAGVMVACLGGTFQFGYTFYVYNQLVTATGNAARYAAMRPYHENEMEKDKAAIRNMVVYGEAKPGPGAAPVVRGLTPQQVDVSWTKGDSGAPAAVHVGILDYKVDALFASYDFAGRPSVEFPYVGPAQ